MARPGCLALLVAGRGAGFHPLPAPWLGELHTRVRWLPAAAVIPPRGRLELPLPPLDLGGGLVLQFLVLEGDLGVLWTSNPVRPGS